MKVCRGVDHIGGKFNNPAVTLGNFDGLHKGHREIFEQLKRRANELGGHSVIFTFDPHPVKVLRPDECPKLISLLSEKLSLLEEAGIDGVILADFTKAFAAQHPTNFIADIIHKILKAKLVIVGHDFTFGKGKEGTIESLKKLGEKLGFRVEVVPAVTIDGEIVSSTRIRKLISGGKVKEASTLLGRYHQIEGTVVKGFGRGKPLGFPTANLDHNAELLPEDGVYATKVVIGDKQYKGATNVGTNPTFGDEKRTVETYILDFDESIYEKTIKVLFVDRVRGEVTFKSPKDLSSQIAKDISRVSTILEGMSL